MLRNNIFHGNSGTDVGGVYIQSGGEDTITLTNNTFYGNEAVNTNSDFSNEYCNAVLIHSNDEDTTPINIYNNISWSNPESDSSLDLCVQNSNGDVNFYNNHVNNWMIRTLNGFFHSDNNISSQDPLFVNPAGGDFHLQAGSTCRNTGLNSAPGIPLVDFEGQPRMQEGTVDRGADEYGQGTVAVPSITDWGMIFFMIFAGIGSVYFLRRHRRADN